jgi:hypothetical protein
METRTRHQTRVASPATPDAADYLAALERDACLRVDAVLKRSASETTELVYFQGANGAEQGPYVRKRISTEGPAGDSLGRVYRELWEAQRAGRRFRYLPRVLDCHPGDGCLVVLMERVAGATLRELVEACEPSGRLGLATAAMPALCAAAHELHTAFEKPVVHRDITPSNVMCAPGDPGSLTVIDLGIARVWNPEATGDTAYFGTRPYAPPEQFGFGQTDVRTDVYALGMVCFFCLTGRDPDRADRARRFADPAVPEPLRAVIARAASLDAADRPAGARELASELACAFEEVEKGGAPAAPEGPLASGTASAPETPAAWGSAGGDPSGAGRFDTRPYPDAAFGGRVRVPHVLGWVWNALVVGLYALLFAACCLAVGEPTGSFVDAPAWFTAWTYLVFVNGMFLLAAYALLDKRRLYARFRRLNRGRLARWVAYAALLAVNFVVWLALCLVSGVHG